MGHLEKYWVYHEGAVSRGSEVLIPRMTDRVLSVGSRRAVPLAVAMLNVSNPGMSAMDALSRLSHDTDAEVAQNAVLALGALHLASLQHIGVALEGTCLHV